MTIRFLIFFCCLSWPYLVQGGWFSEDGPEILINLDDEVLQNNVRAYLAIATEPCSAPKWKITQLADKAPDQARQALKALGYYHPQIDSQLKWLDECWQLQLTIDLGKPVLVNTITLSLEGPGSTETYFQKIQDDNKVKPGDILNHGNYEAIKKQLSTIAENWGFFDFAFKKHQLRVNTETNLADIFIVFNTGERFFFGEVTIEQNFLEPDFVRKLIKIETGEPYQQQKINDTFFVLDGSGYFKQVQVDYQRNRAQNYQAPVKINLQAIKRHQVAIGAGFDTDLGFRGSLEYSNRYINREGHRFKANLSASQRKSYVFLSYLIPLADPVRQQLAITSSFVYEDTVNILSETYKAGVRYTQNFEKEQVLIQQINFVAERFDSGGGDEEFTILLVPGVSWADVIAEEKGFARYGFKYSFNLQGAHEFLLSDVSFIQSLFKFKIVQNLPWDGKIIARTDLGATAVSDFNTLPTSYRFYTGGDNSVRGYQYKSIGAVNAEGEVIGGKFLTVASVEYEQLVYKDWSLALFVDAGDAFNDRLNLKIGVGWGIRWYSLIGPIRVDMAFPSEQWDDFRFHFSFSTTL